MKSIASIVPVLALFHPTLSLADVTRSPSAARLPWHTTWFLVAFYAVGVIHGLRSMYYWQPSVLDWLIQWTMYLCLAVWGVVDARKMRRPIPESAQQWFLFFAGITVPVYVVWTRHWRGVAYVLLHAFLWYALALVIANAGYLVVYGSP
ncbi:MAG: hypothetical protein RBS80_16890 [Thermoguttaceae bacterium]|jgi:hypothetical protein|nr:hypothetical protein [Thermoguttaceae bacterium]